MVVGDDTKAGKSRDGQLPPLVAWGIDVDRDRADGKPARLDIERGAEADHINPSAQNHLGQIVAGTCPVVFPAT